MPGTNLISKLQRSFQQPLPGKAAQYLMAHTSRMVPNTVPENAKESAVLALLYPIQSDWHLALIQRTNNNPNDRHGGQISFPGGRRESTDIDLRATALREAEEEIGISKDEVQVIGQLTDLYIPVSNFIVQPYIGILDKTPKFNPQISEVEHILSPSFKSLQNKENLKYTDMRFSEHITVKNVPYFSVDNKIVWGATAMIISEILVMLKEE